MHHFKSKMILACLVAVKSIENAMRIFAAHILTASSVTAIVQDVVELNQQTDSSQSGDEDS